MKAREEGGFGTEEVKKDIQLMQTEMEQVARTIDKLKKKVTTCLSAIESHSAQVHFFRFLPFNPVACFQSS